MESAESKVDEPFGRQPQPVTVSMVGNERDIDQYITKIMRFIDNQGDNVQRISMFAFRIYPRAVND